MNVERSAHCLGRKSVGGVQEIIVAIDQNRCGFGWENLCQCVGGDLAKAQMFCCLDVQPGIFVVASCVVNNSARLGGHCDELFLGEPPFVAQPTHLGGLIQKAVVVNQPIRNVVCFTISRQN